MKRVVLCISVLAAWFLLFSTLFSLRVEQWMVPSVTVAETRMEGFDAVLSLDCLFDTQEGLTLFAPYEGAAWEAGTRARIVEPFFYQLTQDSIVFSGPGSVIIAYATRLPRPDALVNIIVAPQWEPDAWLAVARGDSLPEWGSLDRRAAIQTQTSHEALLTLKQAPTPFMEKRAWGMAPIAKQEDDLTPWADENGVVDRGSVDWAAVEASRQRPPRFYSLNDLEQWTAQMPKMGLGAGLILAALLWAMELPSSLLPSTHIVDFGHYSQEFSNIFGALGRLSAAGDVTAAGVISEANIRFWLAIGLGAGMGLLAVALGVGEMLVRKKDPAKPLVEKEE